jgi:hypothetical protein
MCFWVGRIAVDKDLNVSASNVLVVQRLTSDLRVLATPHLHTRLSRRPTIRFGQQLCRLTTLCNAVGNIVLGEKGEHILHRHTEGQATETERSNCSIMPLCL